MLRYADMFPKAQPSAEREKDWDEEVREVRKAWELGRERSTRAHGRKARPVDPSRGLRAAF